MDKRSHVALVTTASLGAYLHWISHSIQSPLVATAGYMEMVQQGQEQEQSRQELLLSAYRGVERAQAGMTALAALHRWLGRQDQMSVGMVTAPLPLLQQAARLGGVVLRLVRNRTLPTVCLDHDTALEGLQLLLVALQPFLRRPRIVTVGFRQRGGGLIIHLSSQMKHRTESCRAVEILQALAKLEPKAYPLLANQWVLLGAAYTLLRASDVHWVVRSRGNYQLDLYMHVRLEQQLRLVEVQQG